ncbi:hypothetical protein AXK56_18770 [Tsukamurella pulmonis]|uniref:DUF6779 domain-containing protein n=1 Tax=Tsukamurella pulmonis TaxID=47312 RepID=A0A1H1HIA5_9ACTN|nr:DUF6779 domain-containing protein [Tsukamurella pulmonis]KXO94665.1 hypothetical protein AXK56_18770 [Tsukamurella pulmonis]SDR25250.1 hypothetical protein SAMN04489765_4242 [Tsukamurella pulmonis]SUP14452.1 Uncharacterised protein [Tsukamurella pulmonis]
MLGVVILLAVVGTGLWVFSEDRRWGLVSLILLVWGLVIAAFLIARYSRDLRAAESKESGLKTVYGLQLEREISARREYELQVERDIRAELKGEANEELTALKAEVLALRANLEELLGRDLGPSYSELYAAAEQRALAAQRAKSSVFEDDDRFRAQQDFAGVPEPDPAVDDYYGAASAASVADESIDEATVTDVPAAPVPPTPPAGPAGAHGGPTGPAAPGADRPQEESPTTVFHVVADEPSPAPSAPAPSAPAAAAEPEAQPVDVEHVENPDDPFVPLAPQSGYRSPLPPRPYTPDAPAAPYSPFESAPPQAPQQNSPWQAQRTPPQQAPEDRQEQQVEQPGHAGQHTSGSTVADLIARMNADTERSSGGRRRKPE